MFRIMLVVGGLASIAALAVDPTASAAQYVRTESGIVRCDVGPDQVVCEAGQTATQPHTGFLQAPPSAPFHMDLATVTAPGNFYFSDGNIGGAGADWSQTDLTLGYGQTYHLAGWTVLPTSDGTRFSNDATGHGMFVSIQNVSPF